MRLLVKKESFIRARKAIRLKSISEGYDYHKSKAAECNKDEARAALAQAIGFKRQMGSTFIWLQADLRGIRNPMEQWELYQIEDAPDWARDEHRTFWGGVEQIYQNRLDTLNAPQPQPGKRDTASSILGKAHSPKSPNAIPGRILRTR